ncbi:flavodoxin domain-containing protein [Aestuariicoccus sp. MJ-SS9]|uniref:flavodoxin domain-containing protein n=1 Tax=Aestuariicoccus sp. MJ-SS9 TaxID=3079855 RepID=UPI002912252F|nr:flavodoxin domain-containing protein [Aestuariicoccus sp. MJ-SS9]MDU8911102.1 flavodoxin domain-containing protein [Aestuariicoccus sp. MJ-SS9]
MRILIAYATTEGQTRKICRHCADRLIDRGHSVELLPVDEDGGLDLQRFDAAILAGSVHMERVQPALVAFAKTHSQALARIRTLYLQVSLAAAGNDYEEWSGLRRIARRLAAETGWAPGRTEHVAGAFRFTEYDFFKSWAMRWIAAQHDRKVDPHKDTEFTDWEALDRVLDDWAA